MKRFLAYLLIAFTLTACGCSEPAHAATNATSITFLLSQVRNSSGVLAGGKVYFYAAGTSTPKTVWLNRNKSTVAANPYTLDANGTAALFGDGLYRIVIKTAAGVTVYDRDNVSLKDAVDPLEADVATYGTLSAAMAAIGSVTPTTLKYATDQSVTTLTVTDNIHLVGVNDAAISFGGVLTLNGPTTNLKTSGSGSLVLNGAVNGEPKFRHSGATSGLSYAEPDWWGVDGSSDQTEINKAIQALNTGGELHRRAKTYTIDGEVSVNKTINITGSGTIKIKDNASAGTVATFDMVRVTAADVTIEGGVIDGNRANQSWLPIGSANYGISVQADNVTVKYVETKNVTANGMGVPSNSISSLFIGNHSHDNGKKGFHSGAVSGIRLIGNEFDHNEEDSGVGLHQGAAKTYLAGNYIHHNGTYGVHIGESGADIPAAGSKHTLVGNYIYDNTINNVFISRYWGSSPTSEDTVDSSVSMTGNHVYYTTQPTAGADQWNMQVWNTKGLTASGNYFGLGGIQLYNTINHTFVNNDFVANYSTSVDELIYIRAIAAGGSHVDHQAVIGTGFERNRFETTNIVRVMDIQGATVTDIGNNTFRNWGGGTYEVEIRDTAGVASAILNQPSGRIRLDGVTYTDGYVTGKHKASGVPTSTPARIGDEYLNTATSKFYKATCTTSSACWAILN